MSVDSQILVDIPREASGSPLPDHPKLHRMCMGGYAVAWREAGQSQIPLILIHGGGSDHSGFAWRSTLLALSQGRKVIAVDLPGYGESDVPVYRDQCGVFQSNFKFIADFAAKLGYRQFDLCGFSMGGGVALGCALEFPEMVRQLIIINSYGLIDRSARVFLPYLTIKIPSINMIFRGALKKYPTAVRRGLRNLAANREVITEAVVREAFAAIQRAGDHPMWQAFLRDQIRPFGFKTRLPHRLHELKKPTLILSGGKDRFFDIDKVRKTIENAVNNNIQQIILPECGHLMPLEQPARVVEEINLFLG